MVNNLSILATKCYSSIDYFIFKNHSLPALPFHQGIPLYTVAFIDGLHMRGRSPRPDKTGAKPGLARSKWLHF
ncbi:MULTISPECIES: hypothetical protein [Acidovorax]|uniref:hypothetical protein n=1 Tax=Acidovorax TaxID=12916 RepID=UPI00142F371B|nr:MULTISPECIES: hypothetical protein [Acidovorax]